MSDTHVALLRGVNVGGKNKLPMKALAEMFCGAGCGDVRTLIQSGNVVFTASPKTAGRVAEVIARTIAKELGLTVPVVTRSADELRRAAKRNPFLRAGCDTALLHVGFLMDEPEAARVAALDPKRSPPDEFRVVGREIYLRLPNGAARTKITSAWLDSKLDTIVTVRNWNTVTRLVEMIG